MNFLGILAGSILFFWCCANSVFRYANAKLQASANLTQYPGEQCYRKCIRGERPRICYWKFVQEHYQTMGAACGNCAKGEFKDCFHKRCVTADGVERGFVSINRQLPGPPIHVCHHDIIVVDLLNKMSGLSSTIHWHGLHQRKTPYMDGVPFVTQCPIHYADTFRYIFEAENPGTHFYHSHSGLQKIDGHFGALIVRRPIDADLHRNQYDYDLDKHYILITDWFDLPADMWAVGLPTRGHGIDASSLLINGRGRRIGPKMTDYKKVPLTNYFVQHNKRYRFRIINSGVDTCPFRLQIENHTLTVLSTDSYDVEPRIFNTLISNTGERFDVVIHANQPIGDYFIRIRQIETCIGKPLEGFAVLSYRRKRDGTFRPHTPPTIMQNYSTGIQLNHPASTRANDIHVSELRSLVDDPRLRNTEPSFRYSVGFHNYRVGSDRVFENHIYEPFVNMRNNFLLVGAVNKLSFTFPPFPLLTQPENIPNFRFCNKKNHPANCSYGEVCVCTHLIKIPLNAVVELLIIDERTRPVPMHHPFHLHGGRFMITEMGLKGPGVPTRVKNAYIPYSLWKDTVSIPSKGYAKIRYWADNPGFWLLHCHYDWHLSTGMAMVIQVGEPAQMKRPPQGFPKCNNFKPAIGKVLG